MKDPPYYPNPGPDNKIAKKLKRRGVNVIRLGVQMGGLFPNDGDLKPSMAYLNKIERHIDVMWAHDIWTIIDLHQDVLSPATCGEGMPAWMLNMTPDGRYNNSMPLPMPMTLHGYTNKSTRCTPTGILKSIGWSSFYMTDACGKAFQALYDNVGVLGQAFDLYWDTVSKKFAKKPGVLGYEILNEPWVGDYIRHPDLLFEAGAAERGPVGRLMQRAHDVIRQHDPETPILFSPAEVNNRLLRPVGYEEGFLPGEPMAFHVYCDIGTDGAGPTSWLEKEVCKLDDNFTLVQRERDLKRLGTAGLVTEFGAVLNSSTGWEEISRVLNALDAVSPPLSWLYWGNGVNGDPDASHYNIPIKGMARSYAKVVPGTLKTQSFDMDTGEYQLEFEPAPNGGDMTLFLSREVYYPSGFVFSIVPAHAGVVKEQRDNDVIVRFKRDIQGQATVKVTAK